MLKPTCHYEDLRKALRLYVDDNSYKSYIDCIARVLLDIQVWVGNAEQLYEAVRESANLAIEQHEKAMREIEAMRISNE